jgi:hypothetical protein
MTSFKYPISFIEDDSSQVEGTLELDEPLPYRQNSQGGGFYRQGRISINGCADLDLVLYDSQAISSFIYMRNGRVDKNLLEIVGLTQDEIAKISSIHLPGQLCMGAERSNIIAEAIRDVFAAPAMTPIINAYYQQNLAVFPIAREGLKYMVTEAIYENYGYYCDEVILDAHHVFDSSVPVYNRKVEMTLFKDKDLDQQQHENIKVAFIADSIASGLVMKQVIATIKERFSRLERVEVISPLATIRGLCRIARAECVQDLQVRMHVFETILNALPPDYYFSAHYPIPEFHIRPDLAEKYRQWWGEDSQGVSIANTACAGYGWSEVFYSPRKQIETINDELMARHNLTIAEIVRRNIKS